MNRNSLSHFSCLHLKTWVLRRLLKQFVPIQRPMTTSWFLLLQYGQSGTEIECETKMNQGTLKSYPHVQNKVKSQKKWLVIKDVVDFAMTFWSLSNEWIQWQQKIYTYAQTHTELMACIAFLQISNLQTDWSDKRLPYINLALKLNAHLQWIKVIRRLWSHSGLCSTHLWFGP